MTTLQFLLSAMLFLTAALPTAAMNQDSIVIEGEFFERCRSLGRSPNDYISCKGETALILTCKNNQENFVKELIQARNLKVNTQDSAGNTALHYACQNGNKILVDMLLSVADIDRGMLNLDRKTARDLAFEKATKTYDDNEAQKFFAIMHMLGSKL